MDLCGTMKVPGDACSFELRQPRDTPYGFLRINALPLKILYFMWQLSPVVD